MFEPMSMSSLIRYSHFHLRRWPKSTRCAIYDKTKCIQVISYLTFVTSSALHRIKMAFLSRFLHLLDCHFLLISSASNLLYNPFGAIVSNSQHNTNSNSMDNLDVGTKESPVRLNTSKTIDGIKIDNAQWNYCHFIRLEWLGLTKTRFIRIRKNPPFEASISIAGFFYLESLSLI